MGVAYNETSVASWHDYKRGVVSGVTEASGANDDEARAVGARVAAQ